MYDKINSLFKNIKSREKGTIVKDWGGRISIALVYPNYYRTGMSNLGFQVVYRLLNNKDNVVAERVFLPEAEEVSLHIEHGKGLLSLETLSPLDIFDIVAFSLSFEHDYLNILKILELGKIPLLSEDRDRSHPLVMAGGITTFLNPEPLSAFFDFFLLGEVEDLLGGFADLFQDLKKDNLDRNARLKNIVQNIQSVYVPSFYDVEYKKDGTIQSMSPVEEGIPKKVKIARPQWSAEKEIASSCIVTPDTAFSNKILVELGRGCGRSCRFCAAGYVYRPPRTHGEKELLAEVDRLTERSEKIGLMSPAVSDTPGIEKVSGLILDKECSFSVSSLRADSLSEELVEHLLKSNQRTISIAPEAGSDRLRRVINKHLTKEEIIESVRMIAAKANFGIRFYFLIGLPTETKEDVDEIIGLVKSIKHNIVKESRTRGNIGHIRLSVNCFIPKPFTPFQWFSMEHVKVLKGKQKLLKKAVSKEGGASISFDVPKRAYIQALLSMGDRRVSRILLGAHRNNGDWNKTFRESDLNPDFFVYRTRELDEVLPWDFIDHGLRKEHLIKEYKLAGKEKESDICSPGDCDRCGVC